MFRIRLSARRLALFGMLALTAWIFTSHTPFGTGLSNSARDAFEAVLVLVGPRDLVAEQAMAEQNEADLLAGQTRWAEALPHYDRVIQLMPNAGAHLKRGYARYELEDWDGAIADFSRAASLEPQRSLSHYECGRALMRRGDYGAAVPELTRAIELQPEDSLAHAVRGYVRARDGDADGMTDLNRAIELDAGNAWAFLVRGALRMQDEEVEACKDLRRCVELNPALEPLVNDLLPKATL